MYFLLRKEKEKTRKFAQLEKKRIILKSLYFNRRLPLDIRIMAYLSLAHLPVNSSSTRLTKRCIITGRARSTLLHMRLSRYKFREWIRIGRLTGIRKASW